MSTSNLVVRLVAIDRASPVIRELVIKVWALRLARNTRRLMQKYRATELVAPDRKYHLSKSAIVR